MLLNVENATPNAPPTCTGYPVVDSTPGGAAAALGISAIGNASTPLRNNVPCAVSRNPPSVSVQDTYRAHCQPRDEYLVIAVQGAECVQHCRQVDRQHVRRRRRQVDIRRRRYIHVPERVAVVEDILVEPVRDRVLRYRLSRYREFKRTSRIRYLLQRKIIHFP